MANLASWPGLTVSMDGVHSVDVRTCPNDGLHEQGPGQRCQEAPAGGGKGPRRISKGSNKRPREPSRPMHATGAPALERDDQDNFPGVCGVLTLSLAPPLAPVNFSRLSTCRFPTETEGGRRGRCALRIFSAASGCCLETGCRGSAVD